MATGTGKTRTALNILQELTSAQAIESAKITTIGTDLLTNGRNSCTALLAI